MKVSEIRKWLDRDGTRLTRSLGQHFLHDARQLDRIVSLAELRPADQVLEIGAGLGPLTERLLAAVPRGRVRAFEKDARLAALLSERLGDHAHLRVERADALRVLQWTAEDWTCWRMVSNLPYSVASPILVELTQTARSPERMVVTLQQEVAERVCASSGSRDYGVLTLLVQSRYEPGATFAIGRDCFFPVPKVDSACLRLDLRREPWLRTESEAGTFERLVRRAFSQRRKMIPKLLLQDWPADALAEALIATGIDRQARAEHVSLEQYVALARWLVQAGLPRGSTTRSQSTNEEIFEVVDDRDEVQGRLPRSEVHRRGLKHRAVHVLVFNQAGHLFLQRRSSTKDCFPGVWDSSAAGHLGVGESYQACAVRELAEELGWQSDRPLERLFKLDACEATGQEFVWVYRCVADGPFELHPEEIAEGGWFEPAAVTAWVTERPGDFAPSFPLIWGQLARQQPEDHEAPASRTSEGTFALPEGPPV